MNKKTPSLIDVCPTKIVTAADRGVRIYALQHTVSNAEKLGTI